MSLGKGIAFAALFIMVGLIAIFSPVSTPIAIGGAFFISIVIAGAE